MGFDIWNKVPGVGTYRHLKDAWNSASSGDWGGALKEFAISGDPILQDMAAYQSGQDEKKQGFSAVQAMAEKMKQERMARADATFAKADAMYDPTKKAMAALYGDPSTWSLYSGPAATPNPNKGRF